MNRISCSKRITCSRFTPSAVWVTCMEYRQKNTAKVLLGKPRRETFISQPSSILSKQCCYKASIPVKLQVIVPHKCQRVIDDESFQKQRRILENLNTQQFPSNMVKFAKATSGDGPAPTRDSPSMKSKKEEEEEEQEGFLSGYMKSLKKWLSPDDVESKSGESSDKKTSSEK